MAFQLTQDVKFVDRTYPAGTEVTPLSEQEEQEWLKGKGYLRKEYFTNDDRMFRIGNHLFWLMREQWEEIEAE